MKKEDLHKHAQAAPKPDFAPIKEALGDLMPELTPGKRGRYRLVTALTQRFGENWRMNARAKALMSHFEDESEHVRNVLTLRGVKRG